MHAITLVWAVLGIAGVGFSSVMIVRLPLDDLADALRTAVLLVVCGGALIGVCAALRERWPDLREWPLPGSLRIKLGWFLPVYASLFGFAGISALLSEVVSEPTAGMAFRMGGLFFLSATMLFGAWACYRDFDIGRRLLRFLAIVVIMGCFATLLLMGFRFHATWHGGTLLLLAFSIATLWLSRRGLTA